jgi:hypothetical protein
MSAGISDAWEAICAEFQRLGGSADNIVSREGTRGRGLFPIDPTKPVRIRAPRNLLVPADDLEVRDGSLMVKRTAVLGEPERAFFDAYQRELSWGGGGFNEMWESQLAWSRLPQPMQESLRRNGGIVDISTRFLPPSEELCLKRYILSRAVHYEGRFAIMPMVELINHSSQDSAAYVIDDSGVSVSGTFQQEVLVNYNFDDCWGKALVYGFHEPQDHAYSVAQRFQFKDFAVEIGRDLSRSNKVGRFSTPAVTVEGNAVSLSFLMLGHTRLPRVPRAIFQHLTKNTPITNPDETFDVIQHHNRLRFLELLQVSEDARTPLAATLRAAAYGQLTTLSSYWGTRVLTD